MHQAALGHVVVLDRPMLDHAVVPHQHVARAPLMPIHERRLDDVIRQRGDQRLRLIGLHAVDAGAVVAHHVEASAPRRRMGPHDRMTNRRIAVDFRLSRRKGPLARLEIKHRPPSLEGALHRIRQGIPGRRGTGELGVSQRKPVQLGDLDGVQDGPARWSRRVAHVAVPVLAGTADAGRSTAFRDVGQDDDLGVAGHAPPLTEDVEFDLAEAARERHLLRGRDRLPTEEDDAVFVVGAFDRGERGVVERPGEIHPGDLRAEHGGGRNDFHGHWTILSSLDLAARLPYGSGGGRTSSMARLNGKVAAVSGGASGIGEATVRRFVTEGARVAFADRDVERGKRVAAEIAASGGEVAFLEAHVEREDEAAAFVRQAAKIFGRLDVLVNNAGVRLYHTVEEASAESWDEILGVNLEGYAFCAKAAIPLLRQAGGGSIVNVASVRSVTSIGKTTQYDTTKAAVAGLTRGMAEIGRASCRERV